MLMFYKYVIMKDFKEILKIYYDAQLLYIYYPAQCTELILEIFEWI